MANVHGVAYYGGEPWAIGPNHERLYRVEWNDGARAWQVSGSNRLVEPGPTKEAISELEWLQGEYINGRMGVDEYLALMELVEVPDA